MDSVTSSLFVSVNVDFHMVFRRIGLDALIFVVAILVYWVLHQIKAKARVAAKASFKEAVLLADGQECTEEEGEGESNDSYESQVCANEDAAPLVKRKVVFFTRAELLAAAKPQLCSRPELLAEPPNQLALMRSFAAAKNIKDTLRMFRTIEQSGERLTSPMYNTVMWAWIKVGNVWAAENWMDTMKEAKSTDEHSFVILMKALVMITDMEKASDLLGDMRKEGLSPSSACFDELFIGYARRDLFHDGIFLLKEMDAANVQPTKFTLDIIAKLVNSARNINWRCTGVWQILMKYTLPGQGLHIEPSQLPRLAALISNALKTKSTLCVHNVEIKGTLSRMKAFRRTLKQHGFLDKDKSDTWPLNGHWQTDHGVTVIIERKVARWSHERAYKLRLTTPDRRNCMIMLHGRRTSGQVTQPLAFGATKSLRWDSGDVWHCYDVRNVSQTKMMSQSMTKVLPDKVQDQAYRERTAALLKCLSKRGLYHIPTSTEDIVMKFIGSGLYNVQVSFESSDTRVNIFDDISRRHPRVGFRHCWVKPSSGLYGQRTLANGEETDEACHHRHINGVYIA